MITLKQAKELKPGDILHDDTVKSADGSCMRWRVNGHVKTWKTMPDRIRVPLKHGLYDYGRLTEAELRTVHREIDCEG
jgi:hypothetical protein